MMKFQARVEASFRMNPTVTINDIMAYDAPEMEVDVDTKTSRKTRTTKSTRSSSKWPDNQGLVQREHFTVNK